MKRTMCKLIQRKTYSCLSHTYGIYFAYAGVIIVLYSMFHFGEELLLWSQHKYDIAFSLYHDNIASKSYQRKLCSEVPIDIVYTWVNGSDSDLIKQLNNVQMDIGFNASKQEQNVSETNCNLKNCFLLPLLVIKHESVDDKLKSTEVLSTFPLFILRDVISREPMNVTVMRFKSTKLAKSAYSHNATMTSRFHVTTDGSAPHTMKLQQGIILEPIPIKIKTEEELKTHLPSQLSQKVDWMILESGKNLAFLWLTDSDLVDQLSDEKSNSSLKLGFEVEDQKVKVHEAHFVGLTTSYVGDDIVAKSRFEDNEELRYSLRSVEKYAPWVRHIYLVTNGQIPYWLNLDSPRISVVTHDEIFVNKSHLPTFSSPAIEAHIHRIPGLAKRFIYLNDDVMFGKEVWPDDFYSESLGHKVYLAWSVPNCADGCAPSWITDGYCDAACNVSDCSWDGGDCVGDNIKMGVGMSNSFAGNSWSSSLTSYCRAGCADNWIADKFCDQSCNSFECGFDAGDCGLNDYGKMSMLTSRLVNGSTYEIPDGKHSAYIELSETFSKVKTASYEKDPNLRVAAVSNKFHVLTIVFKLNGNQSEVVFNVSGTPSSDNKNDSDVTIMFKVRAFPSKNVTNATIPEVTTTPTVAVIHAEEPMFIDVPEDQQRPKVTSRELRDLQLPIDLGSINRSLLSEDVRNELSDIEQSYKGEYLTKSGYIRKLHRLLEPFFEILKLNYIKNASLPVQEDDESDVREDAHSHNRGDIGDVTMKTTAHDEHSLLRKDVHIHDEEQVEGVRHNSRKLLSFDRKVAERIVNTVQVANQEAGFLPWERDESFQKYLKELERKQKIRERYSTLFRQRRLLDTFGDSLRFVSGLYNKRFGFTQRKVPAHMPHMIDKNIMYELQSLYPKEYDMTSSHKLRHSHDMQFAFSYFYYLMSEEKPLNYSGLFDLFDTDQSGVLSDREVRLLATRIYDLPLTLEELTSLETFFKDCAWEMYGTGQNTTLDSNGTRTYSQPVYGLSEWAVSENYYDKEMPLVTRQLLLNCSAVLTLLNKTYSGEKKYKYTEMDQSEIAFKMIRTNVSTVVGQLDNIRKHPKKFICLNDNIDHDSKHASMVKAVVRDFYETFFPKQSQFELSYEYRNRFTRIEELREWKQSHERTLTIMHSVLALLLVAVVVSFFWDHVFRIWRKYRHHFAIRNIRRLLRHRTQRRSVV